MDEFRLIEQSKESIAQIRRHRQGMHQTCYPQSRIGTERAFMKKRGEAIVIDAIG
ncbi:hypothetical protein NGM99_07450 [Mesorhizobium sp. RP14(2022)]|uniref:Uncharacterized protein n=1 Tax=Mesorhizobium liriopis TaxID=2953882 RepID=A0ABT1C489_9HYPH|nr:hypothetical protein [Mesorhizobium liriopis]MCO6049624.1 hypothetical protein [Mesorhizobium liriopis]